MALLVSLQIEYRSRKLVNTDPHRRCYNGCYAKSEWVWTPWEGFGIEQDQLNIEARLKFWRDLDEYSVSVGGSKSEYRIREV